MSLLLQNRIGHWIICTIIASLSSLQGFGQGRVLEGVVISPKGDSIKGFIRYDSWESSPMAIDFSQAENGPFEKIGPDLAGRFFITSLKENYVSKKIGILNIDPSKTYDIAPSFEAKDSLTVYLREVTSGPKATLLEYLDLTEKSHFFLEKDGKLTELLYYPFYRLIRGRKYLIQYDEYERQLPALLSDGTDKGPVRRYSAMDLGNYVDRYNGLSDVAKRRKKDSSESEMEIDAYVMGGVEGWKETGINLRTTPTFGVGLRINLPRRFHNRYFKILFSTMRGVSEKEVYHYPFGEKVNLNTMELSIGSYFGFGNIRPNLGFEYSFPADNWRSATFGPHAGISYRRKLSLEITHFANIGSVFNDVPFFNNPRVNLSYYLNLNQFFKSRQ
ncbi:hypothetical protein LZD49_14575 [Dyadobacter sp. CY261]|uniref:hypothetical protein n=1 Tax=Dyadobacter sp. CY261 TaxID=2907203 RepID=UPI001F1880C7|nr:hypothetical protein [Dyadobacter sp. CY261]MCF0071701.1 hypothetical protein [Dyadobacter sp. CY261]